MSDSGRWMDGLLRDLEAVEAERDAARADADRLAEAIRGGQRVKQRLALAAHDAEVAGR